MASPAWTRKEGKNPNGGLNAKGRASAKREGHNLKPSSAKSKGRHLQKWVKSGLLEGIKNETERNTMAVLLENQAKQLVTEASSTGTAAPGAGAYSGESWNGVARK